MTPKDRLFACTRSLSAVVRVGGAVGLRARFFGLVLALACAARVAPGAEAVTTSRADSSPAIIHQAAMGDYGSDYVRLGGLDGDGKAEIAIAASRGETSEQATLVEADGQVLWRKVSDHCQFEAQTKA